MRRTRINPISPAKVRDLNSQVEARVALAQRCGGTPVIHTKDLTISGHVYRLTTVECVGGVCEICGQPANGERLEPHESLHRSLGGRVSLDNSRMCHRCCHRNEHSVPMWSHHNL